MHIRTFALFFFLVLLAFENVEYVLPLRTNQYIHAQGIIEPGQEDNVHVYDFCRYRSFAPWWRARLSDGAKLDFSPNGLNFSNGWGVLYLHETVGNGSAMLELTSNDATFGIGFIDANGQSWRVQWHDGKLWFYHASDCYDNNRSEHEIQDSTLPSGLGIEFLDPFTIGFCAKLFNGSSILGRFTVPVEMSEPRYVQLFILSETACLRRLSVAQTLDQILENVNTKIVEDALWFSSLNITVPNDLRFFGILTQMLGRKGNVPFESRDIGQQLAFLRDYDFNMIKLLLDWQVLMPSVEVFNETAFSWVWNFSQWMNNEGFHVLLSMQSYELSYLVPCNDTYEVNDEWLNSLTDNESLRTALVQTWVRIAQCVKGLDVSYELLNEPDPAESSGIIGFTKLVKLEEEIGNAIRNQDPVHTIYMNIYQWQDKHSLWAVQDIRFNFTNYGFSLHVYPTDAVWQLPCFGYNDAMIQWLKNSGLPILVSEVPMTALDPWISESVLNDLGSWSEAWNRAFSFILGFDRLVGVVFLRYMVTGRDTYSNLGIAKHVFDVFSTRVLNSKTTN